MSQLSNEFENLIIRLPIAIRIENGDLRMMKVTFTIMRRTNVIIYIISSPSVLSLVDWCIEDKDYKKEFSSDKKSLIG